MDVARLFFGWHASHGTALYHNPNIEIPITTPIQLGGNLRRLAIERQRTQLLNALLIRASTLPWLPILSENKHQTKETRITPSSRFQPLAEKSINPTATPH
ncbi:MAG TPA: hypothetical protein VLV18_09455 [Terriglobales bacterium]|nr:hypothetical protein [Terriglobales bacterium]